MFEFFKDLPILWVQDFKCITNEFLIQEYNLFKDKNFNIEKTTMSYWFSSIRQNI